MKKPYLIGEIGINHNGSLQMAKELILLAKNCKFDAVKFQKRDPDICVPKDQKKNTTKYSLGINYISEL